MIRTEKSHLLPEWSGASTNYPREACIHDLFEQQVLMTPDATALVMDGESISYDTLNRRANRLAHNLIELGVQADNLVGLCAERSAALIVGFLAVLKAGGAYVPLDPAYPPSRLKFMLEDAAPRVLLTQRAWVPKFSEFHETTLCLDEFEWDDPDVDCSNPPSRAAANHLAYVIYTSGSTGTPKGVCVEHRSVVELVINSDFVSLDKRDVVGQLSSCSFDAATFEIWGALLNGAKLVVIGKDVALSPVRLAETIGQHDITTMFVTTALFNTLAEVAPRMLGRLTNLLFGGEAVSPRWVRAVLAQSPPKRLLHVYGPTETTTFATWYRVTEVPEKAITVPIGRPLANTQIYVLDEKRQPVAVGESGELFIGGDCVARCYLNQPELTAMQFVENPFLGSGRMYRTGDVVRCLAEGSIEFVGRADHQVKLRGFRIELGEIESTLIRHPEVKDAAVVLREDALGERSLAAFIVPIGIESGFQSTVRDYLLQTLPAHMLPGVIVELPVLPLSPSGKTDRQALATMLVDQQQTQTYVEPRSEVEGKLAQIWANVLSLDVVGRNANFFDLGGHSLMITRAIGRIHEEMSIEIDYKEFYDRPVLADLAAWIETQAADSSAAIEIESVPRDQLLPLSHSQQRVWFLEQLSPANKSYHFQARFRFKGSLNVQALEAGLTEVIRRHEILRTSFHAIDGKPYQKVHEPEAHHIPLEELRIADQEEREREIERRFQEEAARPFDLTEPRLLRWILLMTGEDEYVLLHVEHHIIHDGWSFNVFLSEIIEIYNSNVSSTSLHLPEPTIQFADFAMWQRRWLKGEEWERQRNYWQEKLRGLPGLIELPLDRSRPPVQTYKGDAILGTLSSDLGEEVIQFSKQQGVSPFVTLLSAFFITLHRYTSQEEFGVGVSFANRRSRQVECLIGMVVNNVVIRAELFRDTTVQELLRELQRNIVEASSNQDLPFDQVVDVVDPERSRSHNPLFQVMFSMHDSPPPNTGFLGVDCVLDLGLNNRSAKFDLSVTLFPDSARRIGNPGTVRDSSFVVAWEYNTDLFDRETVLRIQSHYQGLLKQALRAPARRVSDLTILSEPERRQLLTKWNDTTVDLPLNSCVHQLFERRAAENPSAIAISYEGQEISYGDLNTAANRLAHHLISLGVTPNALVGVCVERSLGLMTGLLAVMKAGGTYVPIDPDYPASRVQQMLEDAAPAVVLTHSGIENRFSGDQYCVICLDSLLLEVTPETNKNPNTSVAAEDLVYVIFTSGSTGRPKGVMIPQRALTNVLVDMQRRLNVTASDRLLAVTTLSFDIAALEIFLPLISGARVILASRATSSQGDRLLRLLQESGTTMMQATPATWRLLLQAGWEHGAGLTVLCGGEALTPQLAEQLLATLDGPFWNVYGPTETTIWSTAKRVENLDSRISIGRPLANTQAYILDQNLEPVAVGAAGHLYLGGMGLALGYLNQPELTAERFIASPFETEEASRLYFTGDRARYLNDGSIEFLGRTDHQIKLRGHRIELGEIEAVIRANGQVADAVVVMREDIAGEQTLAAYVVPVGHESNLRDSIREQMVNRLPSYMIPTTIQLIPQLPLTPNGKLDRRALPKPVREDTVVQAPYIAPRTPTERTLATIWCELLGSEAVGVNDDFFALGGHSLLATRLLSRTLNAFSKEVSLKAFFEGPSISQLAEILDGLPGLPESETDIGPIGRSKRRG